MSNLQDTPETVLDAEFFRRKLRDRELFPASVLRAELDRRDKSMGRITSAARRRIALHAIPAERLEFLEWIANEMETTPESLRTKCKSPSHTNLRMIAAGAMREALASSYESVGRALGYADHVGAIHATRRTDEGRLKPLRDALVAKWKARGE